MSVFDELFDSVFFFDTEYRQRRDIDLLKAQIADAPRHVQLQAAEARIEQLELLCTTLVELLVAKGVTTPAELRVLMEQVDLSDGVEDGRRSKRVFDEGPRCSHCQRFLNPRRTACVYCGTPMAMAVPKPAPPKARPDVACSSCNRAVPERDTYFTGQGLVCGSCFGQSTG